MKKIKIYSLLVGIFFSLTNYAQSDWKNLELKGKVKSVDIINYLAVDKFGNITKTMITSGEKYSFNQNGLVTHKMSYGKNGQPIQQVRYIYDEYSNIIEENLSDKDGRLKKRVLCEYNDFNRRTYESIYRFDGSLVSRLIHSYSNDIQPAKILTFDARGKEIKKQVFTYNKKDLSKIKTTTNPSSKLIENVEKFDKNDNLIEPYLFDIEGKVKSKIIYTLDDNGNVTETKYFEKNILKVHRTLTYNLLNFLIEVIIEYPEQNKSDTVTYYYDFDKNTNWVKMVKQVNSIPVEVKERKIVYY
jgi:hypothetical protein